MTTNRRKLLIGAAGLAAIAWSWQRFGVQKVNLALEPVPGLTGWQRALAGGITSNGGNATDAVLLGIGRDAMEPLPASELCDVLYQATDNGTAVAVFTDFFCPNCLIMDAALAARSDLNITWHQLPLLGTNSERVARAILAASHQGNHDGFKSELLKAPLRPSPRFLASAADAASLDPDQLLADMESGRVTAELQKSRAAAETLGIWGTPAITVGKTLILGRLRSDQISDVITEVPTTC